MSELDDRLQNKLQALDNGVNGDPMPQKEMGELEPLISLASQVREVSHPELSAQAAQAGEKRVMDAARLRVRLGADRNHRRTGSRWVLVPALAGAALIFLCVAVSLVSGGIWLLGPQDANTAALTDLIGQVEVTDKDGVWRLAVEGELVRSGQQLRTPQDSQVSLVYFDGSRTTLSPNTTINLTRIDGGWGQTLQVVLDQQIGRTTNNVVPLQGKRSLFVVNTPSGSADVMGTAFNVSVAEGGGSFFLTERGVVQVKNSDGEVQLAAGQATATQPGMAPEDPAYIFVLNDTLAGISGDTWLVSDIPFEVTAETFLDDDIEQGSPVRVAGRISQGKWTADLVYPSEYGEIEYIFTGIITDIDGDIDGDIWTINEVPILVNEVTELDGEFEVGDAVKVKYIILDGGRWLALEIEHLDDNDDDDETPTPTLTADVTGTVTPVPPVTDCTGADPHPTGQKLALRYGVPYEEIMGWFCQRFGFGEIDLAYSLSQGSGIPVMDIFDLRRSGLGWGDIKRRVFFLDTPTPTVTMTATPTMSGTATITPTPTPTGTVTATPTGQQYCTGANPHPTGTRLAHRWGTTYDDIMGWFCRGFGFGEINLAYSLSRQHGVPVDEIFAMKDMGYGWGQIKKDVQAHPDHPEKPEKDKKPKKDKKP